MKNQRRSPRVNRGHSRLRENKKKRRIVIYAWIIFILVFFIIGVKNIFAWIWLFISAPLWYGMYKRAYSEETKTKEVDSAKNVDSAIEQKQPKQPKQFVSEVEKDEEKCYRNYCYDLVVIDFETTGLNSDFLKSRMDEVLSVAIIDQDGNTLLSTLCSTSDRKTWKKSEEIHGITPAMVKGKPTFSEILPQVKDILYKAKKVIAYNIPFEMGFLWSYDAINNFPGGTKIREMVNWGQDPMLMFSVYKGELSRYGDIKWQKLTTAAKHFKYSFKEHDALEDVKATLFVYKALLKYVETYDDKEYIMKYGMSYKKPGD